MREPQLLPVAGKEHRVLADEVAAAHDGKADIPGAARGAALAVHDGDVGQLSPAALSGLLRGELGFTGVIVSDGLEMRAVSDVYGIPETAVRAVLAGTDLLCLGRDQDWEMYADVCAALVESVSSGRMPGERLESAAARVAELRAWSAAAPGRPPLGGLHDNESGARAGHGPHDDQSGARAGHGPRDDQSGAQIGLAAARRAVRVNGAPPVLGRPVVVLDRPLVVEVVPPANMAAGAVPWGLGAWVPAASLRRVSTGEPAARRAAAIAGLLAEAAGRSLVIVVRDAHRYPAAAEVASVILAARPDAVVVEMGLPGWRPPAGLYVATYGAARTSSRAAAELLGLTAP